MMRRGFKTNNLNLEKLLIKLPFCRKSFLQSNDLQVTNETEYCIQLVRLL